MAKKKLLVADLVVLEEFCNGSCDYCLTKSSTIKEKHKEVSMLGFTDKLTPKYVYRSGTELFSRLNRLVDILLSQIDAPIIKVSGGEILLIPEIMDFIQMLSENYCRVQILTNGTLLDDPMISKIAALKNIYMQVSLDGWSLEANHARMHGNEKLHNKVTGNIKKLTEQAVPVEINCVLHRGNIEHLLSTVKSLAELKGQVTFLPYPVRGKDINKYQIDHRQLINLEKLLMDFKQYEHVLPPYAYLESLLEFYNNGMRRQSPCVLPKSICQFFDDGLVVACVNMWTMRLGNVFNESTPCLIPQIGNGKIYDLLARNKSTLYCRKCFTPWDILNLYAHGKLTLDEVTGLPLYNGLDDYIQSIQQ